jgi:A nuclease family of the HNH/ENDO VII superfamily with conserved AHH
MPATDRAARIIRRTTGSGPAPSVRREEVHHIIPQAAEEFDRERAALKKLGINVVNDKRNLVELPRAARDASSGGAAPHRHLHSDFVYSALKAELGPPGKLTRARAYEVMDLFREKISAGWPFHF